MTKPCQFEIGWDGSILSLYARLVDVAEVDRLIRAIEANRWLLAPDAPPETVTFAEAAEPVEAPATIIEPQPAPVAQRASANGHAPAGKLLVSINGITLHDDAIAHGDRSLPISAMELRALLVILKASPNPVGVPWILKRAWLDIDRAVAEFQLAHACKRLQERLPEIGLELHSKKGVGIAISTMEQTV